MYKNTKWQHQQKLERWKQQTKDTETTTDLSDEQLKKWVVNISQYELNDAETKVPTKGLNYAIAPKQIPIEEYIAATKHACSMLPQTKTESLQADMKGIFKSAKPPKSNINKDKSNAVKSHSRLKREGKITEQQYYYLYPTAEAIPRLYCIPKIHKKRQPPLDPLGLYWLNSLQHVTKPSRSSRSYGTTD